MAKLKKMVYDFYPQTRIPDSVNTLNSPSRQAPDEEAVCMIRLGFENPQPLALEVDALPLSHRGGHGEITHLKIFRNAETLGNTHQNSTYQIYNNQDFSPLANDFTQY